MTPLLYTLGFIAYFLAFILVGRIIYEQLHVVIKKDFRIIYWIIISVLCIVLPACSMISYFTRIGGVIEVLGNIGFDILVFLLYLVIFGLFLKIILLILMKLIKKEFIQRKLNQFIILIISSFLSFSIIGYGIFALYNPIITKINAGKGDNSLKIICLSDIHYASFGSFIDISKMVQRINSQQADLVLFVGDVIDSDIDKIDQNDFITNVNKIESTYGVYAVTGNHELKYNTLDEIKNFYLKTNINLLLDEEIVIDEKIKLIGRIDESYLERKDLNEIKNDEIDLPLLVMDHQPQSYKESMQEGATFQISGHTHRGQLFPFQIPVSIFYRLMYKTWYIDGIYKKGDFTSYITRGYGAWGFQMRTNGRAEIVSVNFKY
ncbi:MAG: metallophosphoesterase [Bacilli bacterium]